jgi:TonB family protein
VDAHGSRAPRRLDPGAGRDAHSATAHGAVADRLVTHCGPGVGLARGLCRSTQGAEGAATLRVEIDREGYVTDTEPVSGPSALLAPATEAVRQWRFKPTLIDGEPANVQTEVTVPFQ